MNTIRVSATAARNNFFELLDKVAIGARIIVEKDKKIVAKLIPASIAKPRNRGLMKALKAASKGFVYSKKDNPLRRPGASNFLGRWDKE
mgnify:CR=1 FL=1